MDTYSDTRRPAKTVCFFECSFCSHTVSATGTSLLLNNDNQEEIKKSEIKFEYFSPPVPIFKISKNIPKIITNELLQSFCHFHNDLTASGNKLRRSIEKMCNYLGYESKNLHRNIENLQKDQPNEGKLLMALKILGNEASHSNNIAKQDLIDAFEVYCVVLSLFDRIKMQKQADEAAKNILKKFNKKEIKNLPTPA